MRRKEVKVEDVQGKLDALSDAVIKKKKDLAKFEKDIEQALEKRAGVLAECEKLSDGMVKSRTEFDAEKSRMEKERNDLISQIQRIEGIAKTLEQNNGKLEQREKEVEAQRVNFLEDFERRTQEVKDQYKDIALQRQGLAKVRSDLSIDQNKLLQDGQALSLQRDKLNSDIQDFENKKTDLSAQRADILRIKNEYADGFKSLQEKIKLYDAQFNITKKREKELNDRIQEINQDAIRVTALERKVRKLIELHQLEKEL